MFSVALTLGCGGRAGSAVDLEPGANASRALQLEGQPLERERAKAPAGLAARPPALTWHTQLIGSAAPDLPAGVAVNARQPGAVLQAGLTMDKLVGPFLGGLSDAYVVAYDLAGNVIWSEQFGTDLDDGVTAIVCDSRGSVYVTGFTEGDLAAPANPNPGLDDIFLRKYTADGRLIWTRQFGGMGEDTPADIALDSNGDVFVVGTTDAALPGAVHAGAHDMFLVKYSAAGALLAALELGGPDEDVGKGLAIGNNDTVHMSGHTNGLIVQPSRGGFDILAVKLDPQLRVAWSIQHGSGQDDRSFDVAVNANLDVFLVGSTQGKLAGDHQGDADMFVLSYDSLGSLRWGDQRGTAGADIASGVALTEAGGPVTVGFTEGDLDGQLSAGDDDVFLTSHTSRGVFVGTTLLGSSASDSAVGIAIDKAGFQYVVGRTDGNLDGQPNAGFFDAFTAKFDALGLLQ